jgi:cytochrome P450
MVLADPSIFPEPFEFKPERWLNNRGLQKYQVAFSKGRRACLGIKYEIALTPLKVVLLLRYHLTIYSCLISLAYAELRVAVATIFRNFELELFDTSLKDIQITRDQFLGCPAADANNPKVRIVKTLS